MEFTENNPQYTLIKLNRVLLVDYNKTINFLHNEIISLVGNVNDIITMTSTQKALEYLESVEAHDIPDLTLINLDMPLMDGWKFIERVEKLEAPKKERIKICLLSSNKNWDNYSQMKQYETVLSLYDRPLNVDSFNSLLKTASQNRFYVRNRT